MNVIAFGFYRMKPEVLPPQAKPRGLYFTDDSGAQP
jgi:hypothetical protein